jgi:DNA-binding beta-propeller fold protein YncE
VTLALLGSVDLPPHAAGGFDHGDVHLATGRVFVAHTANGTLDVIDGPRLAFERTIGGCPEASGVLCAQEAGLVFAAARGAGTVLVLDAASCQVQRELRVGPRPNGLAWDARRGQLLVADVEELTARLVDPRTGQEVARVALPGRPRWCVHDTARDRFLVNVREPACVVALAGGTAAPPARLAVAAAGPHGLDLDRVGGRAFVACDGGEVVVLDLAGDREVGRVPIAGEPDAVWYNAARARLYVAIGRPGVLDVVDGRRPALVERVGTEDGAHTTAFDARRQRVYVFLPRSGRAAVYLGACPIGPALGAALRARAEALAGELAHG